MSYHDEENIRIYREVYKQSRKAIYIYLMRHAGKLS